MPNLDLTKIARVIDISGVRTDVALEEVDRIVEASKKHHFIAAFAMPCFTRYLVEQLSDTEDVMVGGVVGFPSGADTTFVKVADAKEAMREHIDNQEITVAKNITEKENG